MTRRTASAIVIALGLVAVTSTTVGAADGQGGGSGSAGASAGDGTVTVGAGSTGTTSPGSSGGSGGTSAEICTYTPLDPATSQLLGIGGPVPGQWVEPYCTGPAYLNPMALIWVTSGQTPQQAMPVLVARQALSEMTLPTPTIESSPSVSYDQIVHVPTWLWINGGLWKSRSVTASAGGVTATATATPVDVVWGMGEGHQTVCAGPGTPYDTSRPASAQSTNCSYTWTTSSAGQPNSSFAVSATVEWRVTWTVIGAVGGGNLGIVDSPTSTVAMRVAEVQAINEPPH